MATYTWSNNGDNTGFKVAVAGAAGGEVTTLYAQTINSDVPFWTFTQQSQITGNGDLTSSIVGFHWYYVLSSVGGVQPVLAGTSTDGAGSIHYNCLEAVKSRITSLSLDGISSSDIKVIKVPLDRGWDDGVLSYPGIVISSVGAEQQSPTSGTVQRDDIEYPVFVSMLAADNQDLVTNHSKYLRWRQRINAAFRQQRLPGTSIQSCTVQPMQVTNVGAWFNAIHHSSLVIRCLSREARGV